MWTFIGFFQPPICALRFNCAHIIIETSGERWAMDNPFFSGDRKPVTHQVGWFLWCLRQ